MPRAVDPGLFGQQLPITHSPLNRIEYRVRKSEFDLSPEAILESMIRYLEDYLFPAIEELTGLDLSGITNLLEVLAPWFDIEGSGFLNGVLDGINLEPGAMLRMIRKIISDALEDVPLLGEIIQPLTGLMGNMEDLERRFQNLFDAFTLDGGELDLPFDDFNPLTVIDRLIDDRINPLEKLAQLIGGVLPDSQKPNWLQEINDNIHNAYANFGEPVDLNTNPLEVLNSILGVFQTGRSASSQISGLNARVLALEGGGGSGSIILDFNGAAATLVALGDWSIDASGGGAGNMARDGSGSLKWSKSGSGSRTEMGRYTTTALATDSGIIEVVLSSTTQTPSFGSATPYTYVIFRMNNTNTIYTRLLIGSNELRLQYNDGSGVTNITPDLGVDTHPRSGDNLRVAFGDAAGANPNHFIISVNGTEVWNDVASAGPVSGASNRHVGVGMTTGTNGEFFFPVQMNPAGLAVISVAEVP